MNPLDEAVVEWLKGEKLGQNRHLMIEEIDRLARNCKLWPIASRDEWEAAINRCLEAGSICEVSGKLRLAPKPTLESQDAPGQLELF